MSRIGIVIAASIAAAVMASSALARDGHRGGFHDGGREFHDHDRDGFRDHDGFRGGFFFGGGGFYDPGYPYAYAYPYPYAYEEGAPPPPPPQQNVWYYCRPANAYYPSVAACPVPWQPVPAQ